MPQLYEVIGDNTGGSSLFDYPADAYLCGHTFADTLKASAAKHGDIAEALAEAIGATLADYRLNYLPEVIANYYGDEKLADALVQLLTKGAQ